MVQEEKRLFAVWQYFATFKQGNAAAKDVVVDLFAGEGQYAFFDYVTYGPDDYASGRTFTLLVEDSESTPNRIGSIFSGSVDNQRVSIPGIDVAPAAAALIGSARPFLLAGTDRISLQILALLQNEIITVLARARVFFGEAITVDLSQSEAEGDIVTTTTYNRVA